MRRVQAAGFEIGIHCHNHFKWQDYLASMSLEETREEFGKALAEFERIFGQPALTAGAPGWQVSPHSRQVYDEAGFLYSSDVRGTSPFLPEINGRVFKTLEIPSTLPTFDELLGRPEYPEDRIVTHYLSLLSDKQPNVLTIHAEIEGMMKLPLFRNLLEAFQKAGVEFVRMDQLARQLLIAREIIPIEPIVMTAIDGRSGTLATQGSLIP